MSSPLRSLFWLCVLGLVAGNAAAPRDVTIRFEHRIDGRPLGLNQQFHTNAFGNRFRVTRLDYLLSDIALRRPDGTWMNSEDWFALISVETKQTTAKLTAVPPGDFSAVRFHVGVNTQINSTEPARWPGGHPLNPQRNNLYWNWQQGYVFLALEGRLKKADRKLDGFSYHLGNNPNLMTVELPLKLNTRIHSTVDLAFDVGTLLSGHELSKQTSTHSRKGDKLAARLARNVSKRDAFTVEQLSTDSFQSFAAKANTGKRIGTPYRLSVSKRFPKAKLPEDNPLTVEGVALGSMLFHDPTLSRDKTVSCASCHDRSHAFTDKGRQFSKGVDQQIGDRNSMPLFNLAWHPAFFWDGRAATLREQALKPIEHPKEMGAKLEDVVTRLTESKAYRAVFAAAFGDEQVTAGRIGLAIEQFLLTLISQDSKFDRAVRGETKLTNQEKRGLQLFVTEHDPKRKLFGADCFHCHGGNLFSNHRFTDNGLGHDTRDLGYHRVTNDSADRGKFKAPTLRNIAVTAPYMHDGRFKTLEEVIEHYDSGVKRTDTLDPNLAKHPTKGLGLSSADKQALVAFLKTLTDESFLHRNLKKDSR